MSGLLKGRRVYFSSQFRGHSLSRQGTPGSWCGFVHCARILQLVTLQGKNRKQREIDWNGGCAATQRPAPSCMYLPADLTSWRFHSLTKEQLKHMALLVTFQNYKHATTLPTSPLHLLYHLPCAFMAGERSAAKILMISPFTFPTTQQSRDLYSSLGAAYKFIALQNCKLLNSI